MPGTYAAPVTAKGWQDVEIPGIEDLQEIGRGGFGVVYRGRETALDRTVAIKVLAVPDVDPESLRRFEREARVLGRLAEHPNIVTVYTTGRTSDDVPYVSMAYLPNGSLGDRLRRDGPMAAQEVADLGVRMAGALETAHRFGVLHRDVKPENILLTSYGAPALADFGIARMIGGTQTTVGMVTASLTHAAPETLEGADAAAPADVYALASTLYALASGRAAFDLGPDGSLAQLLAAVMTKPVPNLSEAGVPAPLAETIAAAMAKAPAARPPTALAFAERLGEAQARLGWAPTEVVVLDPDQPVPDPTPGPEAPQDATRVHVRSGSGPRAQAGPPATSDVSAGQAPTADRPAAADEERARPSADEPTGGVGGADADAPPGQTRRRAPLLLGAIAAVAVLGVGVAVLAGGGSSDDETTPSDGDVAAVADNTGEGRVLFRTEITDDELVAATTDGEALYVLGSEHLMALDPETGLARWSINRADASNLEESLAVAGDLVLFSEGDGIRAVDRTSGADAWTFERELDLWVHVDVQGRALAVGSGVVYGLDILPAQAEELWLAETDGDVDVLPALPDDGAVRFISGDSLRALEHQCCDELFEVALPSGGTHVGTATGDVVAIATATGTTLTLTGFDPWTGGQLWSRMFADADSRALGVQGLDGMVVVFDGRTLRGVDAQSGDSQWEWRVDDDETDWTVAPTGVHVLADEGGGPFVAVLDLYDGTEFCRDGAWWPDEAPTVADRLYVADDDGTVHAVEDCVEVWRYDLPLDANARRPIIIAEDLGFGFAVDDNNWVTGFRLYDD